MLCNASEPANRAIAAITAAHDSCHRFGFFRSLGIPEFYPNAPHPTSFCASAIPQFGPADGHVKWRVYPQSHDVSAQIY